MELKVEQSEIINFNEGNILVSASAGSGKTFVMVERLIRLILEKKLKIGDVLAVTFTELSAEEMKEKIRETLSEKILDGETWLLPQLNEINSAQISTIHSFCMSIIRTYFFIVGVSPDFKILDESQKELLKNRCINKTFNYFYEQNDSDFFEILNKFAKNRTDKAFRKYIIELFNYVNVEGYVDKYLEKALSVYNQENFDNIVSELKEYFNNKLLPYLDKLTDFNMVAKDMQFFKACDNINDYYNILKYIIESKEDVYTLKNIAFSSANFGQKLSDEFNAFKKEIQKLFLKIRNEVNGFMGLFSERKQDYLKFEEKKQDVSKLFKVLNKFREIFKEEKQKENSLDFADLEHYALEVLNDEKALEEIKQRYKYIFVDEYQDVNSVQEEIFSKIQNDNIFMVGDLKQSIYGFRGCRPEFFAQKQEKMAMENQTTKQLNYNFRCSENVIDLVNKIFEFCMTRKSFGLDYKTCALVAGGVYEKDTLGRTEIHIIKNDIEKAESDELLIEQCQEEKENAKSQVYDLLLDYQNTEEKTSSTALVIANIIQKELGKTYYDFKEKKNKDITYSDISILLRSITDVKTEEIVKTLNRVGVPVSTNMEQNVCDFSEVGVLINLLRLIDCYEQDIPLATVLISPFGRFTEDDLIEIVRYANENKAQNQRLTFYQSYNQFIENASGELAEKMRAFKNYFEKIRVLSDFVGAYEILQKLISESGYLDCIYATSFGEEKAKRIKNFMSKAKNGDKYLTVSEFLYLIDNCESAFNFSTIADENAVKLMTIHASKGLEFPVVILANTEKEFNELDDRNEILKDRDLGFALKDYDFKNKIASTNIFRELIIAKQQANRVKEEMRLLYVALTRAKYSLHIVSLNRELCKDSTFSNAKHFVDFIPDYLPKTIYDSNELEFLSQKNDEDVVNLVEPNEKEVQDISNNLSFNYPYLVDTLLPIKTSVSKVNKYKEESYKTEELFKEKEEFEKVNEQKGIIAHKIMQYYNFFSGENFEKQIEKMIDSGIITKEEFSLIKGEKIKAIIQNNKFNNFSGKTLYREKPFLANIPAKLLLNSESSENVLIQGVIDLLVIDKDGAEIIDYKYSNKNEEKMKQDYSLQLNVYAVAVEKALKLKVKSKKIVSLLTGEIFEI